MKIILLSDLHLITENPIARIDDLTLVQWEKLNFIFDYANKNGIEHILQAGDFTDNKRSWNLLQQLSTYLSKQKAKIYLVKGQHDSYYHDMENQKTTTGILISSGLLTLLNKDPIKLESFSVYGASFGEEVPIPKKSGFNILVIHSPIGLKTKNMEYEDAKYFLKKYDYYNLILCGDIHEKFIVHDRKRIICNTGPMLRLEATEYNIEHQPCFYLYDSDKTDVSMQIKSIDIPTSNGSHVLSREHIKRAQEKQISFNDFVEKVRNRSETNTINFEDNLKIIMKHNKTGNDVKSIIDKFITEERNDL